jgi:hypothetical protein
MPRNGYHNAEHIADVVHSVAILLTGALQDLVELQDDPVRLLALLLAAAIHDFEHIGLTGDHLIATRHEWALAHNDRAVLEQHHLAEAFRLLRTPGLNWAAALAPAQHATLRGTVIELVLGTDMKEHFKLLGEFSAVMRRLRVTGSARRKQRRSSVCASGRRMSSFALAPHHTSASALDEAGAAQGGGSYGAAAAGADAAAAADACADAAAAAAAAQLHPTPCLSDAERLLVLKIALKVADLGHLRAPQEVHRRWVSGLCDEFYSQGDIERTLGMPVVPLMCRERAAAAPGALAESQVGFFDVIALPLVHHWARATGAKRWLERVNRNYEGWCAQRDALLSPQHPSASACAHAGGSAAACIAGLPAQLTIPSAADAMAEGGSVCSSRGWQHSPGSEPYGGARSSSVRARSSHAGYAGGGGAYGGAGCGGGGGDVEAEADARTVSASHSGAEEEACGCDGGEEEDARCSVQRRRPARFSEADARGGVRATRAQFEAFRRARASRASIAGVAGATEAHAEGMLAEDPPPPPYDKRALDAASAAAASAAAVAAAAAAALEPCAPSSPQLHGGGLQLHDDLARPARPSESRRSTGAATFEFDTDDAFSDVDTSDVDALWLHLPPHGARRPSAASTNDGGKSVTSWGDSEERFGALSIARSLGSSAAGFMRPPQHPGRR